MPFHVTLPTSAYWLVKQQTVPNIFSPADTGLSYLRKTYYPLKGIFPLSSNKQIFLLAHFPLFPFLYSNVPNLPIPLFILFSSLYDISQYWGGGGSRFHYTVYTPVAGEVTTLLVSPGISCFIFSSCFQIEDAVPKSACAAAGLHPVHAELVLHNLRPAVGRCYMMK